MSKTSKIITLGLFCFLWFVITNFHLVKPIFLPPLPEVILSLTKIAMNDILFTLKRMFFAFVIGTLIAIPAGILLGSFRRIYESIEWFVDFFRSVPVTAMFPLFLIFFGFGDMSKIAMGAWASGFVILVNTIHGVLAAKNNRRIMALTKRATKLQILTKITLPESLPFIFAGMRIGVSWNIIVVIVAEMFIGTKHGLGHFIYDSSIVFDTPSVFAGIIVIGLIGLLVNRIIAVFELKIVHWKGM